MRYTKDKFQGDAMSGHSKWAKIKRGKASEDAKRGAIFTKLGNSIAIAAKTGGDPSMNPVLQLAVDKAKAANMPNANIEKSIKRGTGELGGDAIEEYTFEGYGPGGIGIILEAASDNRNRVTTAVKTALSKNGGNLAEPGSVTFQFTRKGVIRVKAGEDAETTLLTVLDAGAEDAVEDDDEVIVYTEMKQLGSVRDAIKAEGLEVLDAGLQYVPNNTVQITDAGVAQKIMKLMDVLDELDDTTETYSNFDIDESLDI
jgi:YebC/PmpR family DNA-binding regulatory protein